MERSFAINKKINHEYQILEKYQAGIVLSGAEVKSAKSGRMDISAAYVVLDKDGRAVLLNARIATYDPASGWQKDYDPNRSRYLLLRREELENLSGKLKTKGLTALPIRAYIKNTMIKLEIGLCRGKKLFDKKETIKMRDIDRDARREYRKKF